MKDTGFLVFPRWNLCRYLPWDHGICTCNPRTTGFAWMETDLRSAVVVNWMAILDNGCSPYPITWAETKLKLANHKRTFRQRQPCSISGTVLYDISLTPTLCLDDLDSISDSSNYLCLSVRVRIFLFIFIWVEEFLHVLRRSRGMLEQRRSRECRMNCLVRNHKTSGS